MNWNSASPTLTSSRCRFALLMIALLVGCGGVVGPADENDGAGSTPSSGTASSTSDGGATSGSTSRAPVASGSSCKSGVVTGSVCNPVVDVDDCIRTSRTCKCGADEQWVCQDTSIVPQGGATNRPSSIAATGSRTATSDTAACLGVTDGGDCETYGDGAVCDRSASASDPRICTCERKGNDYAWSCKPA